jgi:4'-phosphopantetheinyl transferase
MPAHGIRFEYHASGKPDVAVEQNPRRLRFNVSHPADLALIAVTADRRLGTDIENTRADVDIATLSGRFFSAREYAGLQALPPHFRSQAFFACWTRKGRFIKATGHGLSFPLSDFTVSTHPEINPELEEIWGDIEPAQHWFSADLSPRGGYRATVAVECLPPFTRFTL